MALLIKFAKLKSSTRFYNHGQIRVQLKNAVGDPEHHVRGRGLKSLKSMSFFSLIPLHNFPKFPWGGGAHKTFQIYHLFFPPSRPKIPLKMTFFTFFSILAPLLESATGFSLILISKINGFP